MPLTPTPLPFGFTSADIASIGQARQGLLSGFEQLGQQIRSDINRIATTRQLQSFGQELSQVDPQSPLFPQEAVSIMAKYPLAAQTGVGQAGLNLLGKQHADWRAAKDAVDYSLGGGNPIVSGRVYQYDDQGNLAPVAVEKPVTGRVIQTEQGQQLVNPQTGEVIQNFGARPQKVAPINWTDLGGGKYLVNGKEVTYGPDGTATVGSTSTREAPIDLGNGFMLNHQGIITGKDESGNPVVVQKIGTTLQNITNPLAPEVLGTANRGTDVMTKAKIDVAKQGYINAERELAKAPSLGIRPDSDAYQFLKQTRDDAKAAFDSLTTQAVQQVPATQSLIPAQIPALPQQTAPGPTPTPNQLPNLTVPAPALQTPPKGRKFLYNPNTGKIDPLP